jgi:CRISPR-associated protein Cmr5
VQGSQKSYVTLAKGAPALVMANGLMQGLAYYQNKSDEGRQLVRAVSEWLKLRGFCRGTAFEDVMNALLNADSSRYMWATSETLELLKWIKQLGSAYHA